MILLHCITQLQNGFILRPQKQPYLNKCAAPEALDWCMRILPLQSITPATPSEPKDLPDSSEDPPGVYPGNLPGRFIRYTPEMVHYPRRRTPPLEEGRSTPFMYICIDV